MLYTRLRLDPSNPIETTKHIYWSLDNKLALALFSIIKPIYFSRTQGLKLTFTGALR
jgi:hypothetical protein